MGGSPRPTTAPRSASERSPCMGSIRYPAAAISTGATTPPHETAATRTRIRKFPPKCAFDGNLDAESPWTRPPQGRGTRLPLIMEIVKHSDRAQPESGTEARGGEIVAAVGREHLAARLKGRRDHVDGRAADRTTTRAGPAIGPPGRVVAVLVRIAGHCSHASFLGTRCRATLSVPSVKRFSCADLQELAEPPAPAS